MTKDEKIDGILRLVEKLSRLSRRDDDGDRRGLLTRLRGELEALSGIDVQPDAGPWFVSDDGRVLQSDDFDHDVSLTVSGDFYDDEQRRAYSIRLAKLLGQPGKSHLFVSIPKEPTQATLANMALRYRHDFGLEADDRSPMSSGTTQAEREAILRQMRQLYEEVAASDIHKA